MVDDLVQRQEGEVNRHQFGHRLEAVHGRAHRRADDHAF
jgi:hypothetical protein